MNAPPPVPTTLPEALTLIGVLVEENGRLREEIAALKERLNLTSQNSSKPPSSDPPSAPAPPAKRSSGKSRGGQKGHPRHARRLVPVEQCQKVVPHKPSACRKCGQALTGEDAAPARHQVTELPPLEPFVVEHQIHRLTCSCCGTVTAGELPPGDRAVFGPHLTAFLAVLGAYYRLSCRQTQEFLGSLLQINLALGSVAACRQEVSQALAQPMAEAEAFVTRQPVVNVDETSSPQGNADGRNPGQIKGWLWVVVTAQMIVFRLRLSRARSVITDWLGADFPGVVGSDRHGAYNVFRNRQVCLAHLKRDFQRIAERSGRAGDLGKALVEVHGEVFALWSRVRDGTLSREAFQERLKPPKARFSALLAEGASWFWDVTATGEEDRTMRTCRKLQAVEAAVWTFAGTPGVEPTNNAAERALRPAVIWRKISQGTQSEAGSRFVERLLTTTQTLKVQGRKPLPFLTQAVTAYRLGSPHPSFLPEPS